MTLLREFMELVESIELEQGKRPEQIAMNSAERRQLLSECLDGQVMRPCEHREEGYVEKVLGVEIVVDEGVGIRR